MEGNGPGGGLPDIVRVREGVGLTNAEPFPFIGVELISSKATGASDGDKAWELKIKVKAIGRVSDDLSVVYDMLKYQGFIENYFDSFNSGNDRPVAMSGGEDGEWSYQATFNLNIGNLWIIETARTFSVRVARGNN